MYLNHILNFDGKGILLPQIMIYNRDDPDPAWMQAKLWNGPDQKVILSEFRLLKISI